MDIIEKDGLKLNYVIEYKMIKNAYFKVKGDYILVTCNKFFSKKTIINYLYNNFEKLYKAINKEDLITNKYMYLGYEYELNLIKSDKNLVVVDDKFNVYYKSDYNKVIDKFYKDETKKYINILLPSIEKIFSNYNLYSNKITVKRLKTRWGSCNTRTKNININQELIKLDLKYLEYVLYHEFCHLKYANHQKEFYDFFTTVFPNHRIIQKQLKKYHIS